MEELLRRPDVRLVTLTGPGGTGKTRLGLQVAADLLDHYPDGVFFVALASITDPVLVGPTVAQVLNVPERGGQSLLDSLKDYLREKHLLLVLDNFEQVIAAASVAADLLAAAAGLKILVTSREVLHLRHEHEFPVPPLSVPDPKRLPSLKRLSQYEAVRLFIERATAVKPDFAVTNDNAPAVAEICYRLDGLPLAIELAAARVKIFSPQALLQRLGSRLKLLTGGARDLPARQQTLRNAIAWSYDLLSESEKALFQRAGVFVGGATLEGIEAVCDDGSDIPVDVVDGVAELVNKSLFRQIEQPGDEPRFVMLETIREYALERLAESGEQAARKRHAHFYQQCVAKITQTRWIGRGVEWDKLRAEQGNLRAALEWSLRSDPEIALLLGGTMAVWWDFHGQLTEGRQWLDAAFLAADTNQQPIAAPIRAKALFGAGWLAWRQGDYERGEAYGQESLALYRALGDKLGTAWALRSLGNLFLVRGASATARPLYEQSMALYRELGDTESIIGSLVNLGALARSEADYARSEALLEEALALSQGQEYSVQPPILLTEWGATLLLQGDYERAARAIARALRSQRKDGVVSVFVLHNLVGAAGVAAAQRQATRAVRLLGAAVAARELTGIGPDASMRAVEDKVDSDVHELLDADAFAVAWQEGRAKTLDEAIAYALEALPTEG